VQRDQGKDGGGRGEQRGTQGARRGAGEGGAIRQGGPRGFEAAELELFEKRQRRGVAQPQAGALLEGRAEAVQLRGDDRGTHGRRAPAQQAGHGGGDQNAERGGEARGGAHR